VGYLPITMLAHLKLCYMQNYLNLSVTMAEIRANYSLTLFVMKVIVLDTCGEVNDI